MSRLLKPITTFYNENYGLLLVIASQGCLSLVNVAVKKLNGIDPPVPILELILIRMGITWLFSIALMYYNNVQDPFLGPKGVRLLLLLRGLGGFFGIFGVYTALAYISLSDATVLTFLSPLTTAIAGCIFLNEKFVKSQLIAGLLSLFGVILIARPASIFGQVDKAVSIELEELVSPVEDTSSDKRLLAVGVSLIGVLGSTVAYTCLRAIGLRAHALHSLVSFSSQSVIATTLLILLTHTPLILPTQPLFALLLLEIGVLGFLAQVLLTTGLQHEQAGRATMAIYTQIVWASIFEKLWFPGVGTSLMSVVGTGVIIGSAVYVALSKKQGTAGEGEEGEETQKEDLVAMRRLDTHSTDVDLEQGVTVRLLDGHDQDEEEDECKSSGDEEDRVTSTTKDITKDI
ncbi:hypothetical protein PQX77_011381 [Marasmius sp. AFHP31]|nr:hypothetical protein PQX77_011381 [Marasmius sp. AFHP31]